MVKLALYDGTRAAGTFVLAGKKVDHVDVDVDELASILKQAQAMADAGQKQAEVQKVQAALKAHPKSDSADDARRFLQSIR
jgi:hypothetical protein